MSSVNTPNMNLPVPVVGQQDGPQYAIDIDNCMTIIDGHSHTAGSGVSITPSALNINADLSFGNNNLTNARSLRMQVQPSPLALVSDLGCLYVSGVDLYFNDENGNQIQITQFGGVAGTPGSISNLTPPASASYVAGNETFVWQSDANTPANMDGGAFIFRNIVANSFGLTMQPPALGSDYTITLPTLPGSLKILTIDGSGNMGSTLFVDNTTIEIASNNLQVKDQGISDAKLLDNSITIDKMAPMAISGDPASVGNVLVVPTANMNIASGGTEDQLIGVLNTSGRPIMIMVCSTQTGGTNGSVSLPSSTGMQFIFMVDGTQYAVNFTTNNGTASIVFPVSYSTIVGSLAAGAHTVLVRLHNTGGSTLSVDHISLIAYEL